MAGPLIRVVNLDKEYVTAGDMAFPVLKGINFQINGGEFVAIMGHSGSGKSTLMNILGCLDTPTAGHYFLDGRDTARLSSDELAATRNRLIGFVFQGFNLLPRMTVCDNVALPLLYSGLAKSERRDKAAALLQRVGLEAYALRLPSQLSGGQQQRVAIARALISHPKLILADEPTGNLDTQTSAEIMSIFRSLNVDQGITVVLVTHEADIAAYAQRLIRVIDGQIGEDCETAKRKGRLA